MDQGDPQMDRGGLQISQDGLLKTKLGDLGAKQRPLMSLGMPKCSFIEKNHMI